MSHFPIFHDQYRFTNDEMLVYLKKFPKHKIILKKTYSIDENVFSLKSYHKFKDGLEIVLVWNYEKHFSPISNFPNLSELLYYFKKGEIELFHNFILHFSRNDSTAYEPYQKVSHLLDKKRTKLSPEDYFQLEEYLLEPASIDDEAFDELASNVNNYIAFNKYLKKKKKNKNKNN